MCSVKLSVTNSPSPSLLSHSICIPFSPLCFFSIIISSLYLPPHPCFFVCVCVSSFISASLSASTFPLRPSLLLLHDISLSRVLDLPLTISAPSLSPSPSSQSPSVHRFGWWCLWCCSLSQPSPSSSLSLSVRWASTATWPKAKVDLHTHTHTHTKNITPIVFPRSKTPWSKRSDLLSQNYQTCNLRRHQKPKLGASLSALNWRLMLYKRLWLNLTFKSAKGRSRSSKWMFFPLIFHSALLKVQEIYTMCLACCFFHLPLIEQWVLGLKLCN